MTELSRSGLAITLELIRPWQSVNPTLAPPYPKFVFRDYVSWGLVERAEHDFGLVIAKRPDPRSAFGTEASSSVSPEITTADKRRSRPHRKEVERAPADTPAILAMAQAYPQRLTLEAKSDGTTETAASSFGIGQGSFPRLVGWAGRLSSLSRCIAFAAGERVGKRILALFWGARCLGIDRGLAAILAGHVLSLNLGARHLRLADNGIGVLRIFDFGHVVAPFSCREQPLGAGNVPSGVR